MAQPIARSLNRRAILAAVNEPTHGNLSACVVHDEIDSTNRYALDAQAQGAASGLACIAACQTAGRGSFGKHWQSPPGGNLYLSLLWRFARPVSELSGLSLTAGIATAHALSSHGVAGAGLKWPNDLLVDGRKLAGILVECGTRGANSYAVVGIGINVAVPPASAARIDQPWTDLRTLKNGEATDINLLAATLLDALSERLCRFADTGLAGDVGAFDQLDITRGENLIIDQGNQRLHGIGRGIDHAGALLVDTEQGQYRCIAGQVKLRVPM